MRERHKKEKTEKYDKACEIIRKLIHSSWYLKCYAI